MEILKAIGRMIYNVCGLFVMLGWLYYLCLFIATEDLSAGIMAILLFLLADKYEPMKGGNKNE